MTILTKEKMVRIMELMLGIEMLLNEEVELKESEKKNKSTFIPLTTKW